jgi:hypothetical protein
MAIPDHTRRPHRNLPVEAFHGLQSRRNGLDTLLGRPVSTGLAMSKVTLGPAHSPAHCENPSQMPALADTMAGSIQDRGVAQPGSASALGAEGRRFESCLPDHFISKTQGISLLVCADGLYGQTTTIHTTSTDARHKAIPHVQDPPCHPRPGLIHFSAPRRFPRYYLLARSGPPFALPIPRQRRCRVSARQRPFSHINRTDRIGSLLSLCVVPPNGRRSELSGREKLSGGLN